MKKIFLSLMVLVTMLLLVGCGATSKNKTTIYVKVAYEPKFDAPALKKYDVFLGKASSITEELSSIENNLDNLPKIIAELVKEVKAIERLINSDNSSESDSDVEAIANELETLSDNPAKMFEILSSAIKEAKLTIKVTVKTDGVKVELVPVITVATPIDENLASFQSKFENIFNSIAKIQVSSVKIASDVKYLIDEAGNLTGSMKADFTGPSAMKIPGLTKDFVNASKKLAGVPNQMTKILEKAPKIVTALGTSF